MNKTFYELQIGDVVKLYEGAYGCGTVIEKSTDYVSVIRPYIYMVDIPVCDKEGKLIGNKPLLQSIQISNMEHVLRGSSTIGFETVKLFDNPSSQWIILK